MSGARNFDIPLLPIPGESRDSQENYPIQEIPELATPPQQVTKSTLEQYFDKAYLYSSEHPIIASLAVVLGLYLVGSILKKPQPGVGGKAFYKGGFGPKMTAKELLQILNLRETNLSKKKLKETHRRIMLLNHPDKGGSPFLATKINEAKDFLEKRGGLK